jgi:hypothetical protein
MTIELSMSELSDLIEGLDMAIECMADWAQDPLATPADLRQINASSGKFWRLARKLLAQYPGDHYMRVSVNGSSRPEAPLPSGKAVHGVNGAALKPLARFGVEPFPPVTVSTSRVGRSAAEADGRDA